MNVLIARPAGEGHEPHARHIERCQAHGDQGHKEQQPVLRMNAGKAERLGQDGVLAVPTAEERDAGNRQHANQHGDGSDLHPGIQAAHFRHLLLVMAAMNDAAGAEEEQRLEESVRDEMEQPCHPAADAKRQHHVAELADGRVGQHLLDVGHDDGNGRRHEKCDTAGVGDDKPCLGSEQRIAPADEINACGNHGGSMDQRAHRRWPFHRVRQPHVQRELRRLADAAEEDAKPGSDEKPVGYRAVVRRPRIDCRVGGDQLAIDIEEWPFAAAGANGQVNLGEGGAGRVKLAILSLLPGQVRLPC